jgi:Cu-Zn family superoxide dismutase
MNRALVVLPALLACAGTMAMARQKPFATAHLIGADGAPHGEVALFAGKDGLTLDVEATGLPAGTHGIHVHAVGKCDAPAFTSAGPHLNPAGKMHGTMNPMGSHLGDLPNLVVGSDGTGSLSATLPGSANLLGSELFDADGAAIVIHGGPDDYRTDPSGNSGARIACGVLTPAT